MNKHNHVAFQVNEKELEEFEARVHSLDLTIFSDRKREGAEGKSLYFYDYDDHFLNCTLAI